MTVRKRDLFAEFTEGFDALANRYAGKRTLRTHIVKVKPAARITARKLAKVRKDMNLSRGLFEAAASPSARCRRSDCDCDRSQIGCRPPEPDVVAGLPLRCVRPVRAARRLRPVRLRKEA
jgi:hypothetical protein